MKYSTGRGARFKHSTAMEWNELERKIKKRSRLKHSTGENASIRHACGIELDLKVEDVDSSIEAKKAEIIEKELFENEKALRKNRGLGDDFKKPFKKVTLDY
ncbi:MAG: hypothetical protein ABIL06_07000 [Pseudomonadota bacterium]